MERRGIFWKKLERRENFMNNASAIRNAGVVKLVDTHGLGPCVARHGGSSPLPGTIYTFVQRNIYETELNHKVSSDSLRSSRIQLFPGTPFFSLRVSNGFAIKKHESKKNALRSFSEGWVIFL